MNRPAVTAADRIREADTYLAARTGCYEWRCERYDAALEAMHGLGLDDSCTVFDVGSGWGEFGVRLHTGRPAQEPWVMGKAPGRDGLPPSHARYIPVDAALNGIDLDVWTPPRDAEFFVALELLERLDAPGRLIHDMLAHATRGVIVSTPNPETTDVLGMDATHRTPITRALLEIGGFHVEEASFYGKPADSLFAVWSPLMVQS